uniref:Phosphoglycerate mutase (2,3-diphosphoglycerate-dependent) n=1 Tax=Chromera velia CCMP2878 TaxID=1169474 RepID=A0A0G4HIJ6_9ALVE|eukprot:Cvel_27983.t1-p1 / transcript=Cvel_27983.t1 / gene=Cvel_27983 / organism=Chromera_velia_CCMP2878 / gene_product=Broad-range acid phosphatase DET1, putative / transcript_product=Broad-range acid phosphatase DET1, putative / location=Cvel_scaffold3581:8880-11315(+) / protein_length=701 / sequence_SO=supercontig / SO=protein_coding / is_pseudo=false
MSDTMWDEASARPTLIGSVFSLTCYLMFLVCSACISFLRNPFAFPIYLLGVMTEAKDCCSTLGELFIYCCVRIAEDNQQSYQNVLKPKRIILIRHGESQGNVDPSLYFTVPDNHIPLSQKGHEDARRAGEQLKALVGDETIRFYVSPFRRTDETFAGVAKAFPVEQYAVRYEPRLREQEWGFLPSRAHFEAHKAKRRSVGRFFFRFEGGESGADVYDRVTSFLHSMYRDFRRQRGDAAAKNVVLVSHGFTCRIFVMRFFGHTYQEMERWDNLKNGELVVLSKQADGKYALEEPLREYCDHPVDSPPLYSHCSAKSCTTVVTRGRSRVTAGGGGDGCSHGSRLRSTSYAAKMLQSSHLFPSGGGAFPSLSFDLFSFSRSSSRKASASARASSKTKAAGGLPFRSKTVHGETSECVFSGAEEALSAEDSRAIALSREGIRSADIHVGNPASHLHADSENSEEDTGEQSPLPSRSAYSLPVQNNLLPIQIGRNGYIPGACDGGTSGGTGTSTHAGAAYLSVNWQRQMMAVSEIAEGDADQRSRKGSFDAEDEDPCWQHKGGAERERQGRGPTSLHLHPMHAVQPHVEVAPNSSSGGGEESPDEGTRKVSGSGGNSHSKGGGRAFTPITISTQPAGANSDRGRSPTGTVSPSERTGGASAATRSGRGTGRRGRKGERTNTASSAASGEATGRSPDVLHHCDEVEQ